MRVNDHQGDGARVHRALASPTRGQLLAALRARGPVGVEDLADVVDLHVNTVRAHLAVLEEAGLVASEPEARDRPGRPRLLYHAVDGAAADGEDRGYRFLAEVLAGYLASTSDDPAAAAEEAGTAWGRHLVDAPPPFATVDRATAIARVVDLLGDFGFAPDHDAGAEDRIRLRRCPFLDVAREHPEVVCSIHLGLMRGALDELGADLEVSDLRRFTEPGLCVTELEET